jgi:hypothetical protein
MPPGDIPIHSDDSDDSRTPLDNSYVNILHWNSFIWDRVWNCITIQELLIC